MAHAPQLSFVQIIRDNLPSYFTGTKVLEIGSLDINGSVRQFFTECNYTGIDVGPGKSVDHVCPGEDYGSPSNAFDVVISCEMMEHNKNWAKTWINMIRMMKPDGLLVMTCATLGRRCHGTSDCSPTDSPLTVAVGDEYYANLSEADFRAVLHHDAWFSVYHFLPFYPSWDLYFFGVGLAASTDTKANALRIQSGLNAFAQRANSFGRF